jgi:hypothetical protein
MKFVPRKRLWSVLQLLGSAGMLVILLTHFCEPLQLFPWASTRLILSRFGQACRINSPILDVSSDWIENAVENVRMARPHCVASPTITR